MDSWPNSFDTSSSGTPLLRRSTAKVSRNLWLSNVSGYLDSGLFEQGANVVLPVCGSARFHALTRPENVNRVAIEQRNDFGRYVGRNGHGCMGAGLLPRGDDAMQPLLLIVNDFIPANGYRVAFCPPPVRDRKRNIAGCLEHWQYK